MDEEYQEYIHLEWIQSFLLELVQSNQNINHLSNSKVSELFLKQRNYILNLKQSDFLEPYIFSLVLEIFNPNISEDLSSFSSISFYLNTILPYNTIPLNELEKGSLVASDLLASNILLYYVIQKLPPQIFSINHADLSSYESAFLNWLKINGNSSFFQGDLLFDVGTGQSIALILSKARPDLIKINQIDFGRKISKFERSNNWKEIEIALLILRIRKPSPNELNDIYCILCFLTDFYLIVNPLLPKTKEQKQVSKNEKIAQRLSKLDYFLQQIEMLSNSSLSTQPQSQNIDIKPAPDPLFEQQLQFILQPIDVPSTSTQNNYQFSTQKSPQESPKKLPDYNQEFHQNLNQGQNQDNVFNQKQSSQQISIHSPKKINNLPKSPINKNQKERIIHVSPKPNKEFTGHKTKHLIPAKPNENEEEEIISEPKDTNQYNPTLDSSRNEYENDYSDDPLSSPINIGRKTFVRPNASQRPQKRVQDSLPFSKEKEIFSKVHELIAKQKGNDENEIKSSKKSKTTKIDNIIQTKASQAFGKEKIADRVRKIRDEENNQRKAKRAKVPKKPFESDSDEDSSYDIRAKKHSHPKKYEYHDSSSDYSSDHQTKGNHKHSTFKQKHSQNDIDHHKKNKKYGYEDDNQDYSDINSKLQKKHSKLSSPILSSSTLSETSSESPISVHKVRVKNEKSSNDQKGQKKSLNVQSSIPSSKHLLKDQKLTNSDNAKISQKKPLDELKPFIHPLKTKEEEDIDQTIDNEAELNEKPKSIQKKSDGYLDIYKRRQNLIEKSQTKPNNFKKDNDSGENNEEEQNIPKKAILKISSPEEIRIPSRNIERTQNNNENKVKKSKLPTRKQKPEVNLSEISESTDIIYVPDQSKPKEETKKPLALSVSPPQDLTFSQNLMDSTGKLDTHTEFLYITEEEQPIEPKKQHNQMNEEEEIPIIQTDEVFFNGTNNQSSILSKEKSLSTQKEYKSEKGDSSISYKLNEIGEINPLTLSNDLEKNQLNNSSLSKDMLQKSQNLQEKESNKDKKQKDSSIIIPSNNELSKDKSRTIQDNLSSKPENGKGNPEIFNTKKSISVEEEESIEFAPKQLKSKIEPNISSLQVSSEEEDLLLTKDIMQNPTLADETNIIQPRKEDQLSEITDLDLSLSIDDKNISSLSNSLEKSNSTTKQTTNDHIFRECQRSNDEVNSLSNPTIELNTSYSKKEKSILNESSKRKSNSISHKTEEQDLSSSDEGILNESSKRKSNSISHKTEEQDLSSSDEGILNESSKRKSNSISHKTEEQDLSSSDEGILNESSKRKSNSISHKTEEQDLSSSDEGILNESSKRKSNSISHKTEEQDLSSSDEGILNESSKRKSNSISHKTEEQDLSSSDEEILNESSKHKSTLISTKAPDRILANSNKTESTNKGETLEMDMEEELLDSENTFEESKEPDTYVSSKNTTKKDNSLELSSHNHKTQKDNYSPTRSSIHQYSSFSLADENNNSSLSNSDNKQGHKESSGFQTGKTNSSHFSEKLEHINDDNLSSTNNQKRSMTKSGINNQTNSSKSDRLKNIFDDSFGNSVDLSSISMEYDDKNQLKNNQQSSNSYSLNSKNLKQSKEKSQSFFDEIEKSSEPKTFILSQVENAQSQSSKLLSNDVQSFQELKSSNSRSYPSSSSKEITLNQPSLIKSSNSSHKSDLFQELASQEGNSSHPSSFHINDQFDNSHGSEFDELLSESSNVSIPEEDKEFHKSSVSNINEVSQSQNNSVKQLIQNSQKKELPKQSENFDIGEEKDITESDKEFSEVIVSDSDNSLNDSSITRRNSYNNNNQENNMNKMNQKEKDKTLTIPSKINFSDEYTPSPNSTIPQPTLNISKSESPEEKEKVNGSFNNLNNDSKSNIGSLLEMKTPIPKAQIPYPQEPSINNAFNLNISRNSNQNDTSDSNTQVSSKISKSDDNPSDILSKSFYPQDIPKPKIAKTKDLPTLTGSVDSFLAMERAAMEEKERNEKQKPNLPLQKIDSNEVFNSKHNKSTRNSSNHPSTTTTINSTNITPQNQFDNNQNEDELSDFQISLTRRSADFDKLFKDKKKPNNPISTLVNDNVNNYASLDKKNTTNTNKNLINDLTTSTKTEKGPLLTLGHTSGTDYQNFDDLITTETIMKHQTPSKSLNRSSNNITQNSDEVEFPCSFIAHSEEEEIKDKWIENRNNSSQNNLKNHSDLPEESNKNLTNDKTNTNIHEILNLSKNVSGSEIKSIPIFNNDSDNENDDDLATTQTFMKTETNTYVPVPLSLTQKSQQFHSSDSDFDFDRSPKAIDTRNDINKDNPEDKEDNIETITSILKETDSKGNNSNKSESLQSVKLINLENNVPERKDSPNKHFEPEIQDSLIEKPKNGKLLKNPLRGTMIIHKNKKITPPPLNIPNLNKHSNLLTKNNSDQSFQIPQDPENIRSPTVSSKKETKRNESKRVSFQPEFMKPTLRQSLRLNQLKQNSESSSLRKSVTDNSSFVNDLLQIPLSQKLDMYVQKHPELSGFVDFHSSSIQNNNNSNNSKDINENDPKQIFSSHPDNFFESSIGKKPEMEKTQKIDLSNISLTGEEEEDDEDYF